MGNDGPLLTCIEVEVVGAVWMVDVVPGRLVTVNAGFSASWGRRDCDNSDQPLDLVNPYLPIRSNQAPLVACWC